MPPQYSPQPAPPPFVPNQGGSDPYQFIMSPQAPKRQTRFLPNNSSPKGRVVMVLGGAFVLLMIIWIIGSMLSSGNKSGTQDLVDVVARQQEIVRISQLGVASARSQDTLNLALTAQLALSSDQQLLLARLRSSGIKVSTTDLNRLANHQIDAQLTQANETNQFDTTFNQTMQDQLNAYKKALNTAYAANDGPKTRALLKTENANANTLLGPPVAQSK